MFEQIIKKGLHHGCKKCSQLICLGGNCFVLPQRSKHTRQKFVHFPVSPLEHLSVETKLIAKVLKEQTFVVTRLRSDSINRCPIKPVLSEQSFCRIQDDFTCFLRVIDAFPSSFPSRFR